MRNVQYKTMLQDHVIAYFPYVGIPCNVSPDKPWWVYVTTDTYKLKLIYIIPYGRNVIVIAE